MQVLILGAGRVGGSLADKLIEQGEDVTIVDSDLRRLDELGRRLDVKRVHGNAAHPDVLQEAGAYDAESVFATTGADEINMVASQICYTLFEVTNIVARVRTPAYLERRSELFSFEHLPIKAAVNPELEMAEELCLVVQHPDARQALNLGANSLRVCAFDVPVGWTHIGKQVRDLAQAAGRLFVVPLIGRSKSGFVPTHDERLAVGDTLFILARAGDISTVMKNLELQGKPFKRVMIAGGGHLGARLVRALQERTSASVRLIEVREDRCQKLAEELSCVVLCGDMTDERFLLEENIEHVDAFFALANSDESNLLASSIARRNKTRSVAALVLRPEMREIAGYAGATLVVSPVDAAVDAFRSYFRRGRVLREHSLGENLGKVMEIEALGTADTSELIGRAALDIELPGGAKIFATARQGKSGGFKGRLLDRDLLIKQNDRVVVFVPQQSSDQALVRVQKDIEQVFRAPPRAF
ncbi:MAG: Trk system potassium transporter TrkA [Gammaproteobacteria bacterium]|nr:Trk system potassium transporter TrkA [Gammaproteobacteria bacterium]